MFLEIIKQRKQSCCAGGLLLTNHTISRALKRGDSRDHQFSIPLQTWDKKKTGSKTIESSMQNLCWAKRYRTVNETQPRATGYCVQTLRTYSKDGCKFSLWFHHGLPGGKGRSAQHLQRKSSSHCECGDLLRVHHWGGNCDQRFDLFQFFPTNHCIECGVKPFNVYFVKWYL